MRDIRKVLSAIFIFFIALALMAVTPVFAAVTVAGIKFDETAKIGGGDTVLNGAGVRGVMFLNAYVIGLYLTTRQTDAAAAYQVPGAKRLRVVVLMESPAERLAQSLGKGIEKNHDTEAMVLLKPRLDVFKAALLTLGTAHSGDVADFDWLPKGKNEKDGVLRLTINGKRYGEDIAGEDFYQALMTVWLGERPADRALKAALLGQVAAP
ncbi:MAG: chalcone isomerase family protein [Pseudomonadota bacterium]